MSFLPTASADILSAASIVSCVSLEALTPHGHGAAAEPRLPVAVTRAARRSATPGEAKQATPGVSVRCHHPLARMAAPNFSARWQSEPRLRRRRPVYGWRYQRRGHQARRRLAQAGSQPPGGPAATPPGRRRAISISSAPNGHDHLPASRCSLSGAATAASLPQRRRPTNSHQPPMKADRGARFYHRAPVSEVISLPFHRSACGWPPVGRAYGATITTQ